MNLARSSPRALLLALSCSLGCSLFGNRGVTAKDCEDWINHYATIEKRELGAEMTRCRFADATRLKIDMCKSYNLRAPYDAKKARCFMDAQTSDDLRACKFAPTLDARRRSL